MCSTRAEDLDSIAGRIRAAMCRSVEGIISIGEDLALIKAKLPHGQFGSYIMEKFSFSERAAQNYMNAAAAFKGKTATVASLPPTVLYDLAAKRTPPAVREEIVALLESNSTLAPDEIEIRLRAARQEAQLKLKEEQAAAALQRLSPEERGKRERSERKRSRSKAEREAEEHRRLQERAEAARISKEHAEAAFQLLRTRLLNDELVAFRSLFNASWYDFRRALEAWEPELSAPASVEPPPAAP